jgi:hypothetical protein
MIRAIGSTVHATKLCNQLCYLQSTNLNANAMLRNARENCRLLPSAIAPFEISKSQKMLPDMHSIDQNARKSAPSNAFQDQIQHRTNIVVA